MADIETIIANIMADPKVATGSNFAGPVYRDQPILFPAPRMRSFVPSEIRAMRQIGRGNPHEAKVFYEQGKFMESFEDDFNYGGEFSHYFPTYQHMTDAQLRGYFTWRTRFRKGIVEKTSLSFVFVYIYELLNGIGVDTPEEGFRALLHLWEAYRDLEPRITSYLTLWLKDYVVYHDLEPSLLDSLPDTSVDKALAVLLDYQSHGPDTVFAALNDVSSYNIESSRYYAHHPEQVRAAVHAVFSAICAYHNRSPKQSAQEKLFGRLCAATYTMFRSAVFYQRRLPEDRSYMVSPWHRYRCTHGQWSCERFVGYGRNNKRIGAILKTTDYFLRQHAGFVSTLQPGKTNKILTKKIDKIVAAFLEEERKNAPRPVDIDVSKLQSIRAAAQTLQARLLVEEPPVPVAAPAPPPVEVSSGAAESGLDETERRFVLSLIRGERYQPPGMLVSVLVDGINEKLFDRFGDTVIVDDGGGAVVLDDYKEELEGMIAS